MSFSFAKKLMFMVYNRFSVGKNHFVWKQFYVTMSVTNVLLLTKLKNTLTVAYGIDFLLIP